MVRFKESPPFLCPHFLLLRFEVVIVNMAEVVPLIFFTAMFLPWDSWKYMDVSENSGTPKSSIVIGFSMVFHYKPSMLGYPYFWKHPYTDPIPHPSK